MALRVRAAQTETRKGLTTRAARVLISLWDSLMSAPFLGNRPNISESHSEISTRVPFCIGWARGATCTHCSTICTASAVLPVPGGPCTRLRRVVVAMRSACCWLSLRRAVLAAAAGGRKNGMRCVHSAWIPGPALRSDCVMACANECERYTRGCQAPFPPAVAGRLLLSALAAATGWATVDLWR